MTRPRLPAREFIEFALTKVCPMKGPESYKVAGQSRWSTQGFTVLELVVVLAMLGVMACWWFPALARTKPLKYAYRCQNNLRQLGVAMRQWSEDHSGYLLTCQDPTVPGGTGDTSATPNLNRTRPNWITGILDFNGANPSNWDTNRDLAVSPIRNYIAKSAGLFKCPADASTVLVAGQTLPRVRSYSMSQVFARGEWLDSPGGTAPYSLNWRTYWKQSEILLPDRTFLLIDEHPDSVNDGAFASTCSGTQPLDPLSAAYIIDYPAARHNGAGNLSFADGHADTHHWQGSKIRNAPITYTATLPLNVPAEDSAVDMRWLAANTTVRK